LDILCRCAVEAFLLSHGIRKDARLHLVIRDQFVITLEGQRLRHLNPDERSTAALLRRALALGGELRLGESARSTAGINVCRTGLAELLEELQAAGAALVLLDEGGEPLRSAPLAEHAAFVLSDHRDFAPQELELLDGVQRVSVGPKWLHGHQCITLVHSELDQREAGWTNGLS